MNIDLADYEPKTIDEIIFGNLASAKKIKDITSGKKAFPAMSKGAKNGILLWGSYGTGKTTLANLLPHAISAAKTKNGVSSIFTFVNYGKVNLFKGSALSTNNFNLTTANQCGHHYWVLDEADDYTPSEQSALKILMDRPNTFYILTTNNLAKINGGIKDRSIVVEMNAAPAAAWIPFANKVLSAEGIPSVDEQTLHTWLKSYGGSARGIVELLQELIIDINSQEATS